MAKLGFLFLLVFLHSGTKNIKLRMLIKIGGILVFSSNSESSWDSEECIKQASCEGRCGSLVGGHRNKIYYCACDIHCEVFKDCCKDYSSQCPPPEVPWFAYNLGQASCLIQVSWIPCIVSCDSINPLAPFLFGIYGIRQCPSQHPKGTTDGFLCDFIKSRNEHILDDNILFKNRYCKVSRRL